MELKVRIDELVIKSVTNSEGRTFDVYQCDADGFLIDLSITKEIREQLEDYIATKNYNVQLSCLLTSRTFENKGRIIRVPQARFVAFII